MVCKTESCGLPAVGRSKYCREHKVEAHKLWVSMIREKSEGRASRLVAFRDLWKKADRAGEAAADACIPVPMVVEEHQNMMDDASPVVKQWHVPQGVCGFAWIRIRPGTCAFGHWAKKHLKAERAYHGGLDIWISAYGQSHELKLAYARGAAEILQAGLSEMGEKGRVYADGRLD